MQKIRSYCLLVALLCTSTSLLMAQGKKRSATPHAPGEDIYKHYTGTVGNRQVTLDLRYGYQGASNYGGTRFYYADEPGAHMFIISEPETFDHGVTLRASELVEINSLTEGDFSFGGKKVARWEFIISGNTLVGTWHSADGKSQYPVKLSEDYSKSATLDMLFFSEQVDGNRSFFLGVVPAPTLSKTDAAFINNAQLNFVNAARLGVSDWVSYPRTYARTFTTDGKGLNAYFLPVYNDNGLLTFQYESSDSLSHLCLDLRNKKEMHLSDIVIVDKAKLSALLEKALREKYRLEAGKPLKEWLLVDKMPVTENIAFANKGIDFIYNSDELYKTADKFSDRKAITLFLSYEQLATMLTPAFKKRMRL